MSGLLRVMVVEDSAVVRELLRAVIEADERLTVAAEVASGEEALRRLSRVRPDIITMDVRLPGINGFEVTRRIMAERPTPVVVIAAGGAEGEVGLVLESLRAGAVHVIEKPQGGGSRDYAEMSRRIGNALVDMSGVKLVRNRRRVPASATGALPIGAPGGRGGRYRLTTVVASTGGPKTLADLLNGLGPGYGLPIALVQHMDSGFIAGFGAWLGTVTPFEVRLVDSPVVPRPGVVYLARPERHLKCSSDTLYAARGEPVSQHRPSGDVLFQSVAENVGADAIGVLLTGMGKDGAAGLLEMRRRGAYTIAEDASTAVVYGMPKAAADRGAAREVLPLSGIVRRLRSLGARREEISRVG